MCRHPGERSALSRRWARRAPAIRSQPQARCTASQRRRLGAIRRTVASPVGAFAADRRESHPRCGARGSGCSSADRRPTADSDRQDRAVESAPGCVRAAQRDRAGSACPGRSSDGHCWRGDTGPEFPRCPSVWRCARRSLGCRRGSGMPNRASRRSPLCGAQTRPTSSPTPVGDLRPRSFARRGQASAESGGRGVRAARCRRWSWASSAPSNVV